MIYEEIRVSSWNQYYEIVSKNSYKKYVYRGHKSPDYKIQSSLARAFMSLSSIPPRYQNARERQIIKMFKNTAHLYLNHLPNKDETLEWLSIMQHYGAPTRLIDWTYSPFVAAFFALEGLQKECHVYELDVEKISSENASFELTHKSLMDDKGIAISRVNLFLMPYEPDFNNERLLAQQGLFLIPSNFQVPFDELLTIYSHRKKKICKKYIFDMESKDIQYSLKLLKAMTIDNRNLFSGIEGLCRSALLQLLESKGRIP